MYTNITPPFLCDPPSLPGACGIASLCVLCVGLDVWPIGQVNTYHRYRSRDRDRGRCLIADAQGIVADAQHGCRESVHLHRKREANDRKRVRTGVGFDPSRSTHLDLAELAEDGVQAKTPP